MSIRLKIVILKSEYNKDSEGKHPICLQFTKERKVNRIRLGKSVLLAQWKGSPPEYVRLNAPNKHPNGRLLNLFLNNEISRAEHILLEAENKGKDLSFEDFKRFFQNLQETDFFQWHDKFVKHRINLHDLREATIRRYESQRRKLKFFRSSLKLNEITPAFLNEFNSFLSETLGNSHNTRQKALVYLKSIFDYAKRKEAVTGDPFSEVYLKPKYGPQEFLQEYELKALVDLYNSQALKPSLQHVLRKFIWSCYTGQHFGDMLQIKYSDILEIEGFKCIKSQRLKTDFPYFVPLLEVPLQLISPFPENRDQLIFKPISNQKFNPTIREVAKIVGITKHVTCKVARHTCGHILVSHGVSRDYIQTILGHNKISMTSHYSQIMPGDTIRHIMGKFER